MIPETLLPSDDDSTAHKDSGSQRISWRNIAETLRSPMSTVIDAYRSEIAPVN
jgi:hypothetical protein